MQKENKYKENKQYLLNIIVPFFNAEKYLERCLNSIINQTYKNFQVKLVDDLSTDSSYGVAAEICSNFENFDLYKNSRRLGLLNNIDNLLSLEIENPSNTIDILIDGDDYLHNSEVFNFLNEKYLNTKCLITHGSFLTSKGVQGKKYPRFVREFNLYRKYFWYASHLKTFRHDLWLSINQNDLLDKNGQYFSCATDLAIMFPMLEMAGNRQQYVKDILYVYNEFNPISNHNIRRKEQISAANEIRRKKRYKKKNFT